MFQMYYIRAITRVPPVSIVFGKSNALSHYNKTDVGTPKNHRPPYIHKSQHD